MTQQPSVPFAGLRRNAPALFGGLVILFALSLIPDLTPPSSEPPPVVLVHARIVELLTAGGVPGSPDARVIVIDGPEAGSMLDAYLQGPSGQQDR